MLHIVTATGAHTQGLMKLFCSTGDGCFCQFWHHDGDDNTWQMRCAGTSGENERAARQRIDTEHMLGLVACDDEQRGSHQPHQGRVVGWLKLCPAQLMHKLRTRRLYRDYGCFDGDRNAVYVIACLLVHAEYRHRGTAHALAHGAIDLAKSLDARAIEAIPRQPAEMLRGEKVHDSQLWTGWPALFLELGFEPLAGSDAYPVLRLDLPR